MSRIIVITSGKGGVGKSTTAINIGIALNSLKKDVLIVDANLTTPNVGLYLGAPLVPISLNHVLAGKASVDDVIYEHESGTKVIPSSISIKEIYNIKYDKLPSVIKKLKKFADYIIVDSAAGLGEDSLAALESADEVLIVTNPEMPAVTDALKTLKVAQSLGKKVSGVILTRYTGAKIEMSVEGIRDLLEIPLMGVVPEDKRVKESHFMKNAVVLTHPRSKAAREYKKIAARICGKEIPQDSFYDKFLDVVRG